MKTALMFVLVVLMTGAVTSAMATDSALATLTDTVGAYATSDDTHCTIPKAEGMQRFETLYTIPKLVLPEPIRIFVQGNDQQFVNESRAVMRANKPVNGKIMEGTPSAGDLVWNIKSELVIGNESFEARDSNNYRDVHGNTWNRGGHSSSQTGSSNTVARDESVGVYTSVHMTLYKLDDDGNKEIIAEPEARISGSDSTMTGQYSSSNISNTCNYNTGRFQSSHSNTNSTSTEIVRDAEYRKKMLEDGLIHAKASQAVAIMYGAIADSLTGDRYDRIKLKEAALGPVLLALPDRSEAPNIAYKVNWDGSEWQARACRSTGSEEQISITDGDQVRTYLIIK